MERIRFYDIDSKPMEKHTTTDEKRLCQKEIKKEITFFRKSYKRAHLQVNISGLNIKQAAARTKKDLEMFDNKVTNGSKQSAAKILGISTRKIEYKIKEWS